jgi:hypothetical protein
MADSAPAVSSNHAPAQPAIAVATEDCRCGNYYGLSMLLSRLLLQNLELFRRQYRLNLFSALFLNRDNFCFLLFREL